MKNPFLLVIEKDKNKNKIKLITMNKNNIDYSLLAIRDIWFSISAFALVSNSIHLLLKYTFAPTKPPPITKH